MPYTTSIEDRVVHVAWHGIVSHEDLARVDREIPRIAARLGFSPHVLHTFEEVTGRAFEPIDIYAVALRRKQRKIPVPVRSAVVAQTPETHRLVEVFQALNRSPNLTMECFDSEAAARAWLATP